jgi:hypothetical protein
VISTFFLKDSSDPAWKDDPAMKAWSSFMEKYDPDGDKDDSNAVFGYAAAETLFQVLSQGGNDLSRKNVMRQSACFRGYQNSVALPGITFNTGPADFHPIKQMRLVQFDGTVWQPIGDVIESASLATRSRRTRDSWQPGIYYSVRAAALPPSSDNEKMNKSREQAATKGKGGNASGSADAYTRRDRMVDA